jgi:preprotein translocase subunit YajC
MATSIIIPTIICFGFAVLHYLSLRQDRRTMEKIKRLHERCAENSKAYLRLEAKITTLEKGNQP